MSAQIIINEIVSLINSGNVVTNGMIFSTSFPDVFNYSWRLDNKENIGSSYYSEIDNLETVEKVIKYFSSNQENIIDNLKDINKFSEIETLYLHLFLKV